jgi:hypothetical protein
MYPQYEKTIWVAQYPCEAKGSTHNAPCGISPSHGFFKGKSCRLFAAQMDVKLSDEDVVQPGLRG